MNQPVTTAPSPLAVMGSEYHIAPSKLLDVLRGTVIKPSRDGKQATNEEIAAFVIVANQYGLNPFTREIHAFTDPRRGVIPIVGIDGWARIVNSRDQFDGCEFESATDASGKLESYTCIMHVKGRSNPVKVTEYMAECFRPTDPWKNMPNRMLRHKAFMQAARYAFSISGLYDEDEARDIVASVSSEPDPLMMPQRKSITSQQAQQQPQSEPPEQADEAPPFDAGDEPPPQTDDQQQAEAAPSGDWPISEPQRKRFYAKCKASGKADDVVKMYLKSEYGIESTKDIRKSFYEAACDWADGK